jgi:subtilisin family serine protease
MSWMNTSSGSPFVAAVAAPLKSRTPSLTGTQLRQTLDGTALFGGGMTTDEYGHGIVCADLALDPLSVTQCGQ